MSSLSLTDPQIEAMPAEEVLRWAYDEFGDRLCLTCSWQKQSSALVHLVSELGLGIDVIELDTHLFFKETYETREALVARYDLNLIRPEIMTVAERLNRQELRISGRATAKRPRTSEGASASDLCERA